MEIVKPHLEVSASSIAWSLGDSAFGSLLETVLIDEKLSVVSRVVRIWEPTAPVLPNIAAVVIVETFYLSALSFLSGRSTSKKKSKTMEVHEVIV